MLPPFFSNKSFPIQCCYLVLFVIGGLAISNIIVLLTGQAIGIEFGSRSSLYVIQFISAFGTFFVPALLFSYCVSKSWFSYNEADRTVPPQLVGYVLILSLFILPVIACLGYFNEQISLPESMQKIEVWMQEKEEASKNRLQVLTANSNITLLVLNILALALLPALFEEFLFRGTIQLFFSKWFANKHVATIVTAFIFSAIHFQFFGFIPRFLLGIYLGYLFIWGKSLWLPVIAHFMHNAISLILDHTAQCSGIDFEDINPNQITGFYPAVIFCTFCVGLGIYFLWKKATKI